MKNKPPVSAPVSFRFTPEVKVLLELAAEHSHRSQANLLSVLLREYCTKHKLQPVTPATTR